MVAQAGFYADGGERRRVIRCCGAVAWRGCFSFGHRVSRQEQGGVRACFIYQGRKRGMTLVGAYGGLSILTVMIFT
jgi:hypothetical protein